MNKARFIITPLIGGLVFLCAWILPAVAQQNPETPKTVEQKNEALVEVPESSVMETFGFDDDEDEISEGTTEYSSGDSFKVGKAVDETGQHMTTVGTQEEYEIQNGDTLWDVCGKLLDNAWYWPKLWSLNKYITNPHFIYPGNRLTFFEGSKTSLPQMDLVTGSGETVGSESETVGTSNKREGEYLFEKKGRISAKEEFLKLRPISYIEEKRPVVLGHITHAKEPKMELYYGDTVYLKMKSKAKTKVGDRFYVIEEITDVRDSKNTKLGKMIRRNAVVKVMRIWEKTVEGKIIENDFPIRRGSELIAYRNDIIKLKPYSVDNKLKGEIAIAESQNTLISNNEFVFLNRGKRDGIKEGLELFVIKKGDEMNSDDEENLPEVFKGKMLVVEANDKSSTAYILEVRESLSNGDEFRTVLK